LERKEKKRHEKMAAERPMNERVGDIKKWTNGVQKKENLGHSKVNTRGEGKNRGGGFSRKPEEIRSRRAYAHP